jgi:F0F1-type ATP synthase assembly protein I
MKSVSYLAGLGRYSAIGLQMVAVTLLFAALGWWLDQRTGWEPVFLIVFFMLGSAAGFVVVYRAFQDGKDPKR